MGSLLGFSSLQGRRGLWPIGGGFEFSALGREFSLFLGSPEGGCIRLRRGLLASIGVFFFLLCLGSVLSEGESGLSTFAEGDGSFIYAARVARQGIGVTAGGRSEFGDGSAGWHGLVPGLTGLIWWPPAGDGGMLQSSRGGVSTPLMVLVVEEGRGLCLHDGGCGNKLLLELFQMILGLGFTCWIWAFIFIFYVLFDRGPAAVSSSC